MVAFPPELEARFAPERKLGVGGMGAVFLARDRELDRPVAVKLLLDAGSEALRLRFRREAALLASLEHENVLRVFDFGEASGSPYLVTEYLEGTPGDELPKDVDVLEVMGGVARALEAIHGVGLLHRDIKPANLFRTVDGRILVLDFGLALDPEQERFSRTGQIVGTGAFMAPEILQGDGYSPASDIYAWGVTLFYLVEGRIPYRPEEALARGLQGDTSVPSLERVSADSVVAALLQNSLHPDPAARPTPGQLATRCSSPPQAPPSRNHPVPEPAPPPPSPRSPARRFPPAAVAGLGAFLVGAGLVHLRSPAPAQVSPTSSAPGPRAEAGATELAAMTRAAEYLAERQGEAPEAPPPTTTQHPVPGGPARYADVRFETAWKRLVRSMVAYLDATDEADRDRAAFLRSLGWARHLALHLRQYKVNTDPVDAMFSPSRIAASEDVVTSVARHFLAFQEDTQALAEARLLHEEEPDRDLVLLIGSLVALATPGDQPAVAEAVARTFVRAPGDALLATHHDLTAQKVQRKEPGYERLGASMVEVGSWLADPSAATIIGEVRRWRLRYALGSALAGEGTLATRLAHAVPVGPVPGFRGRPSEVRRGARALEAMGLEYSAAASRLRAIAARLETTTEGSK